MSDVAISYPDSALGPAQHHPVRLDTQDVPDRLAHLRERRRPLLFSDALEDFLAVNRDARRRYDPQAHLIAREAKDRDRYVLSDPQTLTNASSQN
jgi:hypothetical protein